MEVSLQGILGVLRFADRDKPRNEVGSGQIGPYVAQP